MTLRILCKLFIYMCCPQLCSHCGWLLLKCSAIGIGFNGAETNCRIAHILGILLMNSCNTDRFLATTVVCGLSTLNSTELNSSDSELLNSFALAYCCCFSRLWGNIEKVKLGVSKKVQKSISRKTSRIPFFH